MRRMAMRLIIYAAMFLITVGIAIWIMLSAEHTGAPSGDAEEVESPGNEILPEEIPAPAPDDEIEPMVEPIEPMAHDHLSPELLRPEGRAILRQAGMLNHRPADMITPFLKREFGIYQDEERSTITVEPGRESEQFPQVLLNGQGIVWQLGELPEGVDLLAEIAGLTIDHTFSVANPGALQLLYNGRIVYHRMLDGQHIRVQALLPAAWREARGNTLAVINTGHYPVMFNAAWIEKEKPARRRLVFGVDDRGGVPAGMRRGISRFPHIGRGYASNGSLIAEGVDAGKTGDIWHDRDFRLPSTPNSHRLYWGRAKSLYFKALASAEPFDGRTGTHWSYGTGPISGSRRRQTMTIYSGAAAFFHQGGTHLRIGNIDYLGGFVSRFGSGLTPEGFAVAALSQVLPVPGTESLAVNVTPPPELDYPLTPTYWIGAKHSDEAVSILVAGHVILPWFRALRVTAALPWSGPTQMTVRHGACPASVLESLRLTGEQDRAMAAKTETERITVPEGAGTGGLFNQTFQFNQVLLIRLSRPGAEFPEPQPADAGPDQTAGASPRYALERPVVSEAPEGPFIRRDFTLVANPSLYSVLSGAYKITAGAATRGNIGEFEHVAPVLDKSLFIEADLSAPRQALAEGVRITTGQLRRPFSAGNKLVFWVYPHNSEGAGESARLGLAIDHHYFSISLKTGRWQRVSVRMPEQEKGVFGRPNQIMFLTPPAQSGREAGGGKMRFEINGISAVDDLSDNIVKTVTRRVGERRLAVILIGRPGQDAAFRHRFPTPVELRDIQALGSDESRFIPILNWRESAQLIEAVRLRFPDELPENVIQLLSESEAAHCRELGLSAIALIMEIER